MLTLYNPGNNFMTVSVTGRNCDLMCSHCKGTFLKHMEPVSEPEDLYRLAIDLAGRGGIGILVSGGSDKSGRVPLSQHYDVLARIKNETELILNVHTGMVEQLNVEFHLQRHTFEHGAIQVARRMRPG